MKKSSHPEIRKGQKYKCKICLPTIKMQSTLKVSMSILRKHLLW